MAACWNESGRTAVYIHMLTTRRLMQSVIASALALTAISIPTVALLQDGPVQFPIQITFADN